MSTQGQGMPDEEQWAAGYGDFPEDGGAPEGWSRGKPQGDRYRAQDLGRQMPQNVEAEQGVLGGMMLNKEAIADVVEKLTTDDFYRPAHATIFNTVLRLYGEGKEIDPVIVAGRLDRDGQLDSVGGVTYLHLSLIHISEPTRRTERSRMPSSA